MENNRFRKSFFGFKKNDVYDYVENLYKSFDEQLKQKDEEISMLTKQNASLKEQISQLEDKFTGIEDYKSNIADVLLNAKNQAEQIIKSANEESEKVKVDTAEYIDNEKKKLIAFKDEINILKQKSIDIINKYNQELEQIISEKAGNYETDSLNQSDSQNI